MLKDLETRSSQFTPIEIASVESAVTHKTEKTSTLVITLLTLLLAVGLVFLYFQFQYNRAEAPKPVEKLVGAPEPVTPVRPVVESVVAPVNQIIGLQINESSDNLSLEFTLQNKVISYLKERSENSFVYYLKDIRSEIVAPVINDNRWIEKLSITPRDEGVDIAFRTASGVLVETRHQLQDGKQIWAIKLKKVAQKIAKKEPVAKQPVKQKILPKALIPGVKATSETTAEPVVEAKIVKLDIKSSQPELSASEQLQRAVVLLKNRRWPQAEAMLRGLINGPQDLAARTHLLGIYGQNGQTRRFSSLVQESIKRYPRQSLLQTEYARFLFKLNDYQSVIKFLQNLNNPDATQIALVAASYQRLDQHQQAVTYYRRSLAKDNRQAKNWISLGISLEQTAQLEDALRSYRSAAQLGNINARLQAFVEKRSRQIEQALN
jgi:tetratricopeptide (TPR) repeat protein